MVNLSINCFLVIQHSFWRPKKSCNWLRYFQFCSNSDKCKPDRTKSRASSYSPLLTHHLILYRLYVFPSIFVPTSISDRPNRYCVVVKYYDILSKGSIAYIFDMVRIRKIWTKGKQNKKRRTDWIQTGERRVNLRIILYYRSLRNTKTKENSS